MKRLSYFRLSCVVLVCLLATGAIAACGGESTPPSATTPTEEAANTPAPSAVPHTPTPRPTMAPIPASNIPLPTRTPTPLPSSTPTPRPTITAADLERSRAQLRKEHPEESWDLISPRYDHDAVLLDDGRVLLGGGFTGVANNNVIVPFPMGLVELYDPDTDVWTPLDPVEGPGYMYSLVKLTDGKVLALGVGESDDDAESMAALFDPATSLWSELPGSPVLIRAFPNAFLLNDGTVLVAGGLDFFSDPSGYSPDYVGEFEIFHPATGQWQRAASPSKPFEPEVALEQPFFLQLSDGRLAALGSERTDENWNAPRLEIYDPTTDTWTTITGLDPYFRIDGGVALADGRLLVHGQVSESAPYGTVSGADGEILRLFLPDGTELTTNEEIAEQFVRFKIYDPDADTWTPAGETIYSRPLAIMTLLPNGRVLAAGGEEGWAENDDGRPDNRLRALMSGAPLNLPHSTTEIYDPRTDVWSLGPDLAELRIGSTATVLLDGRVLLAGGIGMVLDIEEIYPLPTSEIVDPDAPPGTAPGTGLR